MSTIISPSVQLWAPEVNCAGWLCGISEMRSFQRLPLAAVKRFEAKVTR